MATKLGISQSVYKDIESGKTDLKVRHLFVILECLGITLSSKSKANNETTPDDLQLATKGDVKKIKEQIKEMNDKLDRWIEEIYQIKKI
ncbi:MAG: helix-turn-helix transcriptional regulator [Bacteroidia bacterium]|nr:helix-turn-helix transcriptional regulator [Bacteroidia bacterium]